MASSGVIPESAFDFFQGLDWLGRPEPVNLDFSRLPFCECGVSYLAWVRRRLPDILDSPTPQVLDQALLTITKEYEYRKQLITPQDHPLNFCIHDVYEELRETITNKQEELKRHPPPSSGAKLVIGRKDKDDDEGAAT